VTTGLVDAVSVLGLGHRFTANMPGNSRAPVCWPGCLWAQSAQRAWLVREIVQPPGPTKSVVAQVLHTKLSLSSTCSYAFVFELFYWRRSARRIASHRGVQSHARSSPSNTLHNFSARHASMVPISPFSVV